MRATAEVAGTGVTANAVCPGWVRTAMMERAGADRGDDRPTTTAEAALVAQMLLGRALEPEEVAEAVFARLSEGCGDQRTGTCPGRWRMSPFRASAGITRDWKHFDCARRRRRDGDACLDKLNALTFNVYADLRDLLGELPHRGDVRSPRPDRRRPGFCSAATSRRSSASPSRWVQELLEFTRMSGTVVKAMRETPILIVAAAWSAAPAPGCSRSPPTPRIVASSAKSSFFTKVAGWGGHGRGVPAPAHRRLRTGGRAPARRRGRGCGRPRPPGDARRPATS